MGIPQRPTSAAPSSPKSSHTVVVIDDDPSMVEVVGLLLEQAGYEVEGFTDPVIAMERLSSGPEVGLVLADCVMPRMSGGELLEAMEERGIRTPVVLMTALSDPNFCVSPGRAPVLSKPFAVEDLLAEVAAKIGSSRSSEAPSAMPEERTVRASDRAPKGPFWRWMGSLSDALSSAPRD